MRTCTYVCLHMCTSGGLLCTHIYLYLWAWASRRAYLREMRVALAVFTSVHSCAINCIYTTGWIPDGGSGEHGLGEVWPWNFGRCILPGPS